MTQITFDHLQQLITANDYRFNDICGDYFTEETPNEQLNDVLGYIDNTSEKMAEWLKARGLWTDHENRILHYDSNYRIEIQRMAMAILAEYDSLEETNELWDKFDLGGDDDVDYSGSHILIFLDCMDIMGLTLPAHVQYKDPTE